MAMSPATGGQSEVLENQIARLRAQLEVLMKDTVTPAVAAVAGRAEEAAQTVRERADVLAGQIKERPLTAMLVGAALGWVVGMR